MAIAATHVSDRAEFSTSLPGRRYDHLFFSAMAVLILATVFAGFAPSYYFPGIFRAPLPSRIIHVHGAVFSCWILLLITQTSLVSAGRVDVHRRLGIAGFVLACLMVVVGVLAATNALVRGVGRDPLAFYMVSIVDMMLFPTLVFFAFRARFPSASAQAHYPNHHDCAHAGSDRSFAVRCCTPKSAHGLSCFLHFPALAFGL